MNQKLKELKEAIENSSIEYEYVAVYKDKFVLIYHVPMMSLHMKLQ